MNKLLQHKIEEAANYFLKYGRTENEVYLLNIILDLGKEYNRLVEEYNELLHKCGRAVRTNSGKCYTCAALASGKEKFNNG